VASGLKRQALHAAILGFTHPISGEALRFETAPPHDMKSLQDRLQTL
jgi:23S rRNA pseudouridine1911/1915/1917 synthase